MGVADGKASPTFKEGLFEEDHYLSNDMTKGPRADFLLNKMTKFVLGKNQEELDLATVAKKKMAKDEVFDKIMKSFTSGKKL